MLDRRSRLALYLAALFLLDCRRDVMPEARPDTANADAASPSFKDDWFVDRTDDLGVDFIHDNGGRGEMYIAEVMGAGLALFDQDGDGDLDLFLVQGGPLEGDMAGGSAGRLYRNELTAGDPSSLRFVDITQSAGLVTRAHGMGVATGDFDDDGAVDLYLTNFGTNQLLRNRGDGSFEDVTQSAGVDDPRWSVPALFFDFDRDGRLDLFVGNYLDFRVATHVRCSTATGRPDYCGPMTYAPVADRLFRNRGDGSFDDVSVPSGIAAQPANSLGAVAFDADGDGWLDLYVANDARPNLLWRNRGDGTFEELAELWGAATNAAGRPEASMGIAVEDLDNDGDEDLVLTHLTGETNTFYENQGGAFEDRTARTGLGPPSLPMTGFGVVLQDLDGDGDRDAFVANGAIRILEELAQAGDPLPLHQPNQVYENEDGRFEDASIRAGAALASSLVSRGVAWGDLDNDGDLDLVVSNNGGPAQILINQREPSAWLGLRILERSGRDALGARVTASTSGREIARYRARYRVRTDGSYASASDPRLLLALEDNRSGDALSIEVEWVDGPRETFSGLALNRYHELRRGTGRSTSPLAATEAGAP